MHDREAAHESMAMLDEMRVLYRVVSDYQIKIGRYVSYYPSTGRIFIDGEKSARREKGLHALRVLLFERGLARRPRHADDKPTPSRNADHSPQNARGAQPKCAEEAEGTPTQDAICLHISLSDEQTN